MIHRNTTADEIIPASYFLVNQGFFLTEQACRWVDRELKTNKDELIDTLIEIMKERQLQHEPVELADLEQAVDEAIPRVAKRMAGVK